MIVRDGGRPLEGRNVDVREAAQIVVVISPWCHFAQGGIHDIEADPRLRRAFANHARWLVPPFEPSGFVDIARWNRGHPMVPMSVAYSVREWQMLGKWGTPTFYSSSRPRRFGGRRVAT